MIASVMASGSVREGSTVGTEEISPWTVGLSLKHANTPL